MPIAEVILKEAEALAAPISAAEPSGKNPAGDERYQELRVEVDKESAPTGEPVRWPRVGQLGAEILQKVAKDLLVAGYMAYGMYRARGLQGLAVGFVAVDLLFDRHWEGMFPPVSRLKGRGTALRWLLEHATAGLASYTPVPADRAAINALVESSKSLRGRAREKLGDHVPSFKEWTDLLESMRQTLPPEAEAAPEPAPAPVSTAVTTAVSDAPVAKDMSPGTSTPAPAAEAPAAPAGPDPKALAAAWLAPIPGPNPAGSDATGSEEYQGLLAEVDKLQSPSGGTVAWPKVIQAGDVVLKRQAKDLRVACHLALGRYRSQGLAGLALGLAVLAEMSDQYWDTMQPPASRVRGRLGALRGLLDQLEPELTGYLPKPADRPAIVELKVVIKRLQEVLRARLGDQAPVLRLLIQTVEQLAMTVAEPPPPPPPPPVPAARPPEPKPEPPKPAPPPVAAPPTAAAPPPAAPAAPAVSAPAPIAAAPDAANSAAIDRFLRGLGEELVKLGTALRRARSADPLAYRLLRTGLYVYIAAPPPSQPDGGTQIPGVNEKERERLEAMRNNGRWAELLEACESMLPMNRYALDLQRYSAEALRQLGGEHENGRRALVSELGAMLNRLPQVVGFKDRDGVPLANDATRAWLDAEVLGGGKSGGGAASPAAPATSSAAPAVFTVPVVAASPPGAEQAQLKALFAANKRDEALRLAAALIQGAASGRDKFLRRLELAEACLDGKDPALARTLFTGLAAEIEALHLDTWEPALAVRGFEGLARSIPKNQPADKPALDAALVRLATLDPLRAATQR